MLWQTVRRTSAKNGPYNHLCSYGLRHFRLPVGAGLVTNGDLNGSHSKPLNEDT
jgi:hypothetical protein